MPATRPSGSTSPTPAGRLAARKASRYSAPASPSRRRPRTSSTCTGTGSCPATAPRFTSDEACRTQPDSDAVVGSLGPRWPDGDVVSRDGGLSPHAGAEPSDHVDVHGDQSPAARGRASDRYVAKWGPFEAPGNPTRNLVRVTELTGAQRRGAWPGRTARRTGRENYDNPNTLARRGVLRDRRRTTTSSATSAGSCVEDIENHGNDLNLAYTFLGGRPTPVDAEPARLRAEGPRADTRRCTFRTSGRWGG